jgi:hypothetical protein
MYSVLPSSPHARFARGDAGADDAEHLRDGVKM